MDLTEKKSPLCTSIDRIHHTRHAEQTFEQVKCFFFLFKCNDYDYRIRRINRQIKDLQAQGAGPGTINPLVDERQSLFERLDDMKDLYCKSLACL